MIPFRAAFLDELVKLGAFPQQSGNEQPYNAASSKVMDQYQGTGIATGLKTGQPLEAAPAPKKVSPTPLTTPNQMVGGA